MNFHEFMYALTVRIIFWKKNTAPLTYNQHYAAKDEINVPIALSAFRDKSKHSKTVDDESGKFKSFLRASVTHCPFYSRGFLGCFFVLLYAPRVEIESPWYARTCKGRRGGIVRWGVQFQAIDATLYPVDKAVTKRRTRSGSGSCRRYRFQ